MRRKKKNPEGWHPSRTFMGRIDRGDGNRADTDLYVGGGKRVDGKDQPSYVMVRSDVDDETLRQRLVSAAYPPEDLDAEE